MNDTRPTLDELREALETSEKMLIDRWAGMALSGASPTPLLDKSRVVRWLAERLPSLLEDAERLDWISENFVGAGPSLKHEGFDDYYALEHVGRRAASIKSPTVPGCPSLREAIDAARFAKADAAKSSSAALGET